METKTNNSKKEKVKTIYNMQLHDELYFEEIGFNVLRVVNGWIYSQRHLDRNTSTAVFVPYHKEFEWNELRKVDKDLHIY